jgi:lipid-binding SYLF domain-containing protein
MKITLHISFISVLTVSIGTLLAAPADESGKSDEFMEALSMLKIAVNTLDNVMENPGNGIPQSLINQSEAFVVFPRACQVAAGAFNGAGGKGVAMIYNEDGSWSNPFFVTLREGNLGFRIGPETSDIVLLIKDRNDIIDIDNSAITLGGDVGIAAGPDHNVTSSSSENIFMTGIYSYHLNEGLFTGVNLKGAILGYSGEVDDLIYSIESPDNDQVNELILAINMFGE